MEGFYARTRLLIDKFQIREGVDLDHELSRFAVAIFCQKELARTVNGQIMAFTLMNLLARFCRNVYLHFEGNLPMLIGPGLARRETFLEALHALGSTIDERIVVALYSPETPVHFRIAIGPSAEQVDLTINSDGWIAQTSSYGSDLAYASANVNPVGAQVAACLGAAEAFRALLRRLVGCSNKLSHRSVGRLSFSTLDYSVNVPHPLNPPLPEVIDLGSICLVGVGAVGSALLHAFSFLDQCRGVLLLIDPEIVDKTNLNRYLIAGRHDIGKPKVVLGQKVLAGTGLLVPDDHLFHGPYEAYSHRADIEAVVSTVDRDAPRIHLQSDLPRLVLHGATGDEVCTVARLDFLRGACLGCLFPERPPKTFVEQVAEETGILLVEVADLLELRRPFLFQHAVAIARHTGLNLEYLDRLIGRPFEEVYREAICGVVRLRTATQNETATVSFVSAISGFLLAGELFKECIPELRPYALDNYFKISLFSPGTPWRLRREKEPSCRCLCSSEIMHSRYREKWPAS